MLRKILPAALLLIVMATASEAGHGNDYIGKANKQLIINKTIAPPETIKAVHDGEQDLTESPITILLSV